jgi:hypothetical protein
MGECPEVAINRGYRCIRCDAVCLFCARDLSSHLKDRGVVGRVIPCGLQGLRYECLRQEGNCQDTRASEDSRLPVYYVILVYLTAGRYSE